MPITELERFRAAWEMESGATARLLDAIPDGKYDFRPDPGGRSLGEMAWHLAKVEGYLSDGVSKGAVTFQDVPPSLKRPREVRQLGPGYRQVREDAVARLAKLTDADLDREI